MREEIRADRQAVAGGLSRGLEMSCADDLTGALMNLADGTCDYVELIPLLEEVAARDWFCYFDDNGAGGFPHPDPRQKTSFREWALKAIENIRENARFEAGGEIAQALKSNDNRLLKKVLELLAGSSSNADVKLIPILEKIARKDAYGSYSYYSGFNSNEFQLGELARRAIRRILENSEKQGENSDPAA